MIRDQRHMFTGFTPQTVAEVRRLWEAFAQARGLRLYDTHDVVKAYVSAGRWVARCPNPDCSPDGQGGEAAWPENDRWACLTCGVVCDIEFPDATDIEKADVILAARDHPAARNWDPETETLDRLQAETILLGFRIPDGLPADFMGISTPDGLLGPSELLPEFDRVLQAQRLPELERGR